MSQLVWYMVKSGKFFLRYLPAQPEKELRIVCVLSGAEQLRPHSDLVSQFLAMDASKKSWHYAVTDITSIGCIQAWVPWHGYWSEQGFVSPRTFPPCNSKKNGKC